MHHQQNHKLTDAIGEALPQLLTVHPPLEVPLFAPGGVWVFTNTNPFYAVYYQPNPGVDSNNVRVLLGSDASGWQDISTQFTFSATRADLKPGGSFAVSNGPSQVKLRLPVAGFTNAVAEFVFNYTVLDQSLKVAPYVANATPFLLAQNASYTVVLEGWNFARITGIQIQSASNPLEVGDLTILDQQTNLSKTVGMETVTYDTISVQVDLPVTGLYYVVLNGVPQTQAPLVAVDGSQSAIDQYVNGMTDQNNDGQINSLDLPLDGNGLPDASQVVLPPDPIDPYAYGNFSSLAAWILQLPGISLGSYDAQAANVFANMATLGYAASGVQGSAPLVIVSPQIQAGQTASITLYSDTCKLAGLAPNTATNVFLQFASGVNPPVEASILGQSGLYAGSTNDPVAFVIDAGLVRPAGGTEHATLTAALNSGAVITMPIDFVWSAAPSVKIKLAAGATLPGYHSLYNALLVDGAMQFQTNYCIAGTITNAIPLNAGTLRFRLDNEAIPSSLFDISPATGTAQVVTFRLKNNARIDIHARWANSSLTQYLSLDRLVYGPHTLDARVQDVKQRVGDAVVPFVFDHGAKVTVFVANNVTAGNSPLVPQPSDSSGWSTYYWQVCPAVAAANYQVVPGTNASIDASDFAGGSANANYTGLANGFVPSGSAQGPVAITLSGDPTWQNGALEQLAANSNRTFNVGMPAFPQNNDYPYSSTSNTTVSSTDGSTITYTTYTRTWAYHVSNSGTTAQASLDLTKLFHTSDDTFATNASLSLSGTVSVKQDGPTETNTTVSVSTTAGNGVTGAGSPGGTTWSGLGDGIIGGSGVSWGSGAGQTSNSAPPILRTATLSPLSWIGPVGGSQNFHLAIGAGNYGPTNPGGNGCTSAGSCITITGNPGDLTKADQTGDALLTAQFPCISNSLASSYLALAGASDPNPGMYYYNMRYWTNFQFYVEGIAVGNEAASLTTNSVSYAFLPVSAPYAAAAVDEATLLVEHVDPSDPYSPVFLSYDLLIQDPVSQYAADPTAYPPTVTIGGQAVPASDLHYVGDDDHPGVYSVHVENPSVTVGTNKLDFIITDAVGEITHAEHVVVFADEDGLLLSTPTDLYLWSQNANIATIQRTNMYVTSILGEFKDANKQISGGGILSSSMTLQREDGRFGRYTRPFYIVDNYPMDGEPSLPSGGLGVPVAIQPPGGTVAWQTESQNVTVYVEGITIVTGGSPTHNLIPGEIAPSSFTLAAYVNKSRPVDASFALSFWHSDGSPILLGNGSAEVTIPAQAAGTIFDGRGEKYVGASAVQIVSNLNNGARYVLTNGVPTIVLHQGEFVKARFAGLSTIAGELMEIHLDGDCNQNGNYADDQAAKVTAPGLLVAQMPDSANTMTNGLVKIRLTGLPGGTSAGQVSLTATATATGGQIRVWSTNASDATLLIDTAAGLNGHVWLLDPSVCLKDVPQWLYVQGVSNSTVTGDVQLQANYGVTDETPLASDKLVLTVGVQVSLHIDSSNQYGVAVPPPDPAVDAIKDLGGSTNYPGKIVFMNDMDVDGDGIPDFFDGFELPNGDPCVAGMQSKGNIITGGAFVPVVLDCSFPAGIDTGKAKIEFTYIANDPGKIPTMTLANAAKKIASDATADPLTGRIRIWTKNADQQRNAASVDNGGDFVPGNTKVSVTNVVPSGTNQVVLYVEGIGVSPNWGTDKIGVKVYPDPSQKVSINDEVSYTVVRCVYKICNWRPYKCIRDPINVSKRVVFRTNYDSPDSLLRCYLDGELGFDDYEVNHKETHGMGAFMGHTYVRIESRMPSSAPDNRWVGQTGENNNKQMLSGYEALAKGQVWWFSANDGSKNPEGYLEDNFNYYYVLDMGPHLIDEQTNVDKKQVAVREFRVCPETDRLLREYVDSVHDFRGYGLDVIADRTTPQDPLSVIGKARCGCGSFVGLLCQYAGVCDNMPWRVDHPMAELALPPISTTWLTEAQLGEIIELEYHNGIRGSLKAFLTDIQTHVTTYLDQINATTVPPNALKQWDVTPSTGEFKLRKMMYSDPGKYSDWIDDTNAATSVWSVYPGYKDRGVTVLYQKTERGDIGEWKHADPLYYPY